MQPEQELKPWEQRPDETDRAYECFNAYLQEPPPRLKTKVYRRATGRTEARELSGAWRNWIKRYDWDDRVRAYDLHCDRLKKQESIAQEQERHKAKLEQFRQAHEQVGIAGFDIALRATGAISRFLKANPEVESLKEAQDLARITDTFLRTAPGIWEQALGIPQLQSIFQEMAERDG